MATYDLHAALSKLDAETRTHLETHGFSAERLERLSKTLVGAGDADARRDARNRVSSVRPPEPGESETLRSPTRRLEPPGKWLFARASSRFASWLVAWRRAWAAS